MSVELRCNDLASRVLRDDSDLSDFSERCEQRLWRFWRKLAGGGASSAVLSLVMVMIGFCSVGSGLRLRARVLPPKTC